MKPIACWTLALALLGAAPASAAPGASGLHVVSQIAGPDGGWDFSSFDPARRRLYIAHGMQVTAVDVDSGKVEATFAPGNRLHAVTLIPGTDRLVTTNSGDNTARILNADTGVLVGQVTTAADPDAAIYDPAGGDVWVMGGHSGIITIVDPKAATALGQITVGGSLEYPAFDGQGRLFVNNESLSEIDVVDMAGRKVVARYPLKGCDSPSGLAFVAGGRLVSACANGVAEIVDAASGRILETPKIGLHPDQVIYDAARGLVMIPAGQSGNLTVISVSGAHDGEVIDVVPTKMGARSGSLDPASGRLYLPAADYDPPAAPGHWPTMKPGTFVVLVLDR